MTFSNGLTKISDVKTLGQIYSHFRKDPKKLKLYNDLVTQAKRYHSTVNHLERTAKNFYQHGRGSPEMVEAADRGRRLAHNSFMSHLQGVTRNASKEGVNVQKMAPVLQDRNKSTSFALELARRFRPIQKS